MGTIAFTGLDWFTTTTDAQPEQDEIRDIFFDEIVPKTGQEDAWSWRGFVGYNSGPARWGRSYHRDILILSGGIASEFALRLFSITERCSRVDLQVTVETEYPYDIRGAYSACRQDKKLSAQRNYSYITSTRGGQTLYVGKRTSNAMGRLYDKGAEMADRTNVLDAADFAGRTYRYEVELKKGLAESLMLELMRSKEPVSELIAQYVHNWFRVRGVDPVFEPDGKCVPILATYPKTTNESRLDWLARQVRPSVGRLAEAGLLTEAISALGLSGELFTSHYPFEDNGIGIDE